MFTTSNSKPIRLFAVLAVGALALLGSPARGTAKVPSAKVSAMTVDEATKLITGSDGTLRFDVAEDGTRFIWSGDPPLTDGLPDHDNPYITQDYIYPDGTLTGSNGVLADGSP